MADDSVVGPLRDEATGQYDPAQLQALWTQHAKDYRDTINGVTMNNASLAAFLGATPESCRDAMADQTPAPTSATFKSTP